jgi:excisionase family DNA binding protein
MRRFHSTTSQSGQEIRVDDHGRPPQPEPLTLRIPDACRVSGIGRSKLYELIKAREIPVIKVGAITLIPMSGLRTFLGLANDKHH